MKRTPATSSHRPAAGLTLIEVMTTLAILALLASLALPGLSRAVDRWKLQAVAERLAHDLGTARFDAARQGRPLEVVIADGPQWCWSVSELPGCGCGEPMPCQRLRVAAPRQGHIELAGATTIVFDATASARLAGGSVEAVTRHGDRLRIVLTPLGRARICSPQAPVAGYAAC